MKVLFVEDEQAATVGLRALLEASGHQVDIAETADKAVERLREHKYNLIILDIMIGESRVLEKVAIREAGKELLLRLRSGNLGPLMTQNDVRVVTITAVSDLAVRKDIERAGNVRLLFKPIAPEDAMSDIEQFISGERSEES